MKHVMLFEAFKQIGLSMFDTGIGSDVSSIIASKETDPHHYNNAKSLLSGEIWKKTKAGKYAITHADELYGNWLNTDRKKWPAFFSDELDEHGNLQKGPFLSKTALMCAILDNKAMDANEYVGELGMPGACFKNAQKAHELDPGYDVMVGLIIDKANITRQFYPYSGQLTVHAFLRSGGAIYDPTIRRYKEITYYPLEVVEGEDLHQHDIAIRAWTAANSYEKAINEYTQAYDEAH